MNEQNQIHYRSGYKYQLDSSYQIRTPIRPGKDILTEYIVLDEQGVLDISRGYAWDGPTGAKDRPENMRGSLVHDALYQLMRLGYPVDREKADRLFCDLCIEDGLPKWIAWVYYKSIRTFGLVFSGPESKKTVYSSP